MDISKLFIDFIDENSLTKTSYSDFYAKINAMLGQDSQFYIKMLEFLTSQGVSIKTFPHIKEELKEMQLNIEESLFEDSDIHGKNHCEIVAILSMLMASRLKIADEDKTLLKLASLYHDIGRINDDVDKKHGFDSFEKLEKTGLLKTFGPEQRKIIKFLMAAHAIDNEEAKPLFEKMGFDPSQKDRVFKMLDILKDADAIDRIRLKDSLDFSFLRNKEVCAQLCNVDMILNAIAFYIDCVKEFRRQIGEKDWISLNLREQFIYLTSPKFNDFNELKKFLFVEIFGFLKGFDHTTRLKLSTQELLHEYYQTFASLVIMKDEENLKFYRDHFKSKLILSAADIPLLKNYFQTIIDRGFQAYYLDIVKDLASLVYSQEKSKGFVKFNDETLKLYKTIISIYQKLQDGSESIMLKYEIEKLDSTLQKIGSKELCGEMYDNRKIARAYTKNSIGESCQNLRQMIKNKQLVEYDISNCPKNIRELCEREKVKIFDLDNSPKANIFIHVSDESLPLPTESAYSDDHVAEIVERRQAQGEELAKNGANMSLSVINKNFDNAFFPLDLYLAFGYVNLDPKQVLFTMSADGWTINEGKENLSTQVEESLSVDDLVERAAKRSQKINMDCYPEILYSLKAGPLHPDFIIAAGEVTETHIKLSKAFNIPILLHEKYKSRSQQNCYEKSNYEFRDLASANYFYDGNSAGLGK